MARKAVVDAVMARLDALWDGPPIMETNVLGDAPGDGSAFVMVQFPVANEHRATFGAPGANIYREEGGIRFVINVERGKGVSDALTLADKMAGIFRGKEFQGVQTFAPSSPAIDDRNEEGLFYQVSVVVPYHHDILG